jgi:mono/diheme cytochrome c family protein
MMRLSTLKRRLWSCVPTIATATAVVLAMTACHRDMVVQPYKRPLQSSPLFPDKASSRPLVPGTVSREDPAEIGPVQTGVQDGKLIAQLPMPITAALLARGQERYAIDCAVCHGADGYGHGMVVQRGFPAPPSLHTDRLRSAPAGHFFDVMTRGYGVMYSYAARVSVEDRWAITAYIRALQLSQHAPAEALPEDIRAKLAGQNPQTAHNSEAPR